MKDSIQIKATACERAASGSCCGTGSPLLRSLLVFLFVTLAGCALPETPLVSAPPVHISEHTWQQVDSSIVDASSTATDLARDHARVSLDRWRDLVRERTEADFIPWLSSYWTQQWLSYKMAWYKLGAEEGTDPTVKQLAEYLQGQYHERVLAPVAKEIDPDAIREQTTEQYVRILGKRLQDIRQRYGVPSDQFDGRIKDIPAIVPEPPSENAASLYQLVHADPIGGLPAYGELLARIGGNAGGTGPSEARLSPMAQHISEKLAPRLITTGGAGAVAAVVGGIPGMIISLGAAGIGAMANEKDRPAVEALIRESLDPALDDMRRELMEDRTAGVMAAVYSLSGQIEGSLAKTMTQPVESEPVLHVNPEPDKQIIQDKNDDDEVPVGNDDPDE